MCDLFFACWYLRTRKNNEGIIILFRYVTGKIFAFFLVSVTWDHRLGNPNRYAIRVERYSMTMPCRLSYRHHDGVDRSCTGHVHHGRPVYCHRDAAFCHASILHGDHAEVFTLSSWTRLRVRCSWDHLWSTHLLRAYAIVGRLADDCATDRCL